MTKYVPKDQRRACSQCGKNNAIKPARLCPTCKRANKKASSTKSHENRVMSVYGLAEGDYAKLVEASGNKCMICGRGSTKRLAVDHDHNKTGKESVRGILCLSCNHYLLGKIGHDDPDLLEAIMQSALLYLRNPPAQTILKDEGE